MVMETLLNRVIKKLRSADFHLFISSPTIGFSIKYQGED